MSFKCQKTQRLLSDYIDATLSGHQMKNIAEHLDTCWPCKREAIDLKKMCHLLENFYVEPEASDAYYVEFTETLQQRIEHSAPAALHQRVCEISTRLTWQLTTRVRRYIDRCLPTGHISVRQKMLPYYTLVAAMMALLVAPFALKPSPSGDNSGHPLQRLYAVAKSQLFSTSIPISREPIATLAIQQETAAAQPAEIRRNVNRNRTTERPMVDSSSAVWRFTDEPIAEGYILTTLDKNSKRTLPRVDLNIDSELLTYAELPSQAASRESPTAREVLTDGRYTFLLLQGIRSGQQALQQYQRKWSHIDGFSRKLLDVPLETLSITEVYDSIEL